MTEPGPPDLWPEGDRRDARPPREARAAGDVTPVPWTWPEALGVFGLSLVVLFVAGGFLAVVLRTALPEDFVEVAFMPLSLAVLAATVVGWVRLRHPGATWRLGGPARPRGSDLWVGVGVGLLAFLGINLGLAWVLSALADLRGQELPMIQEDFRRALQDPRTAPLFALGAVVFAPIAEELFFRGMLFQALRDRFGQWPATGMSAAAWGLAHPQSSGLDANLLVFVIIFPLGMVLAWVFHRSGTLLVPLVTHAVFNAAGVALMLGGWG